MSLHHPSSESAFTASELRELESRGWRIAHARGTETTPEGNGYLKVRPAKYVASKGLSASTTARTPDGLIAKTLSYDADQARLGKNTIDVTGPRGSNLKATYVPEYRKYRDEKGNYYNHDGSPAAPASSEVA
jgi:hypothetical protein